MVHALIQSRLISNGARKRGRRTCELRAHGKSSGRLNPQAQRSRGLKTTGGHFIGLWRVRCASCSVFFAREQDCGATRNELSEQGFGVLIDLIMLIEVKCELRNLCNWIVFVAKVTGSVRPVGLVRIQVKVWEASQRHLAHCLREFHGSAPARLLELLRCAVVITETLKRNIVDDHTDLNSGMLSRKAPPAAAGIG